MDHEGKTPTDLATFMDWVRRRNGGESEFLQAVEEVAESVLPVIADRRAYREACVLERLTEPERLVSFRVTWEDDGGRVRVNRGWRVQFSSVIGPCKGGLRFHPTVSASVLKFLGFEQVFKNSLTGLSLGGAKGGADFDPKGRSDAEVRRFCCAFMDELFRHIGPDTDVPAGDIGVGSREIGLLFGRYRRLANAFNGVLTGKGPGYGGSHVRTEATGYGLVYFVEHMLEEAGEGLEGKRVAVSGAGNVAIYAAEKLIELGARPVTMSDSSGFVHDPDGLDAEKLAFVKDLKEVRRGRISEYAEKFRGATFAEGTPWGVEADVALPCATQNELGPEDAERLIGNGVVAVAEGANMPTQAKAVGALRESGVLFAPGKAANAGGVAVSGLEMAQNSARLTWSRQEVDVRLREIMREIHGRCVEHGGGGDRVDYVRGANVGGFVKVADAMLAQGLA